MMCLWSMLRVVLETIARILREDDSNGNPLMMGWYYTVENRIINFAVKR